MGDGKKYEPKPPEKTRWKKGQSGNPTGRKKRDALIDEFFEAFKAAKDPRERRWVLLERLFSSALNPSRKDHAKLLEMALAYCFGKPRERIEMSGPGGAPIQTADATPARRRTTGELRKRFEELMRKREERKAAAAAAAAAATTAAEPAPAPPEEPGASES